MMTILLIRCSLLEGADDGILNYYMTSDLSTLSNSQVGLRLLQWHLIYIYTCLDQRVKDIMFVKHRCGVMQPLRYFSHWVVVPEDCTPWPVSTDFIITYRGRTFFYRTSSHTKFLNVSLFLLITSQIRLECSKTFENDHSDPLNSWVTFMPFIMRFRLNLVSLHSILCQTLLHHYRLGTALWP